MRRSRHLLRSATLCACAAGLMAADATALVDTVIPAYGAQPGWSARPSGAAYRIAQQAEWDAAAIQMAVEAGQSGAVSSAKTADGRLIAGRPAPEQVTMNDIVQQVEADRAQQPVVSASTQSAYNRALSAADQASRSLHFGLGPQGLMRRDQQLVSRMSNEPAGLTASERDVLFQAALADLTDQGLSQLAAYRQVNAMSAEDLQSRYGAALRAASALQLDGGTERQETVLALETEAEEQRQDAVYRLMDDDGLDEAAAKQRVATMSDAEVMALNGAARSIELPSNRISIPDEPLPVPTRTITLDDTPAPPMVADEPAALSVPAAADVASDSPEVAAARQRAVDAYIAKGYSPGAAVVVSEDYTAEELLEQYPAPRSISLGSPAEPATSADADATLDSLLADEPVAAPAQDTELTDAEPMAAISTRAEPEAHIDPIQLELARRRAVDAHMSDGASLIDATKAVARMSDQDVLAAYGGATSVRTLDLNAGSGVDLDPLTVELARQRGIDALILTGLSPSNAESNVARLSDAEVMNLYGSDAAQPEVPAAATPPEEVAMPEQPVSESPAPESMSVEAPVDVAEPQVEEAAPAPTEVDVAPLEAPAVEEVTPVLEEAEEAAPAAEEEAVDADVDSLLDSLLD